jgi:hypothetical protein
MRGIFVLALVLPAVAAPQLLDEIRIDTDHPRLFLHARRLKLLQREKERQSIRWQQFELLIGGGARMPEQGFAQALYYQVTGDKKAGQRAVDWALSPGSADLRQLALVFDWCQPLLNPAQAATLAGKLRTGMDRAAKASAIPAVRNGVLAAVALAGHVPKAPESHLSMVVNQWWDKKIGPGLKLETLRVPRSDFFALFELLHAVRDNTNVDLRESAAAFFKDLPAFHLLSHYPAPYPAAENEYRLPVYSATEEPDLNQAALSRAAELCMVAFDANSLEHQFLQGWLIRDHFLMRGAFGIPYEFLWANPYQPGLSVYHMPLFYHDALAGRLLVRSSWDEEAEWFGHIDGITQWFAAGKVTPIQPQTASQALELGEVTILFPSQARRTQVAAENAKTLFVVGLTPRTRYDIEVDDEEMREEESDAGGILALNFAPGRKAGLRMNPAPQAASPPGVR